jgi:glucan phosphoethanolaminetransferase (alkaline phosphatase superfamily)
MTEQIKNVIISVILAILAYLEPIEAELQTLFLVFFLNFLFGYISGMVKGEDFSLKKALICVLHAAIFFVLCAAVYIVGRLKGQMAGAVQCVSFITYLVIYFYGLNILRNLKKIFKENTPPWHVVNTLYFILRFKFIEHIPYLSEYLDKQCEKTENHNTILDKDDN